MNHEIKQLELRVVEQNMAGKDDALGIMSTKDALALAESKGLDLILISDQR
jgi:translation initiation factor IF-3